LDFALYPDALDAQVSRPNPTAGGITPPKAPRQGPSIPHPY